MIDLAALTQALNLWNMRTDLSDRERLVMDGAWLPSRLWQPCQTCDGKGEVVSTCHDEHDAGRKKIRCGINHTDLFACPSCGGVGVEPTPLLHDLTHKLMSDIADPSKTVRVDEFALALWRVANEETD